MSSAILRQIAIGHQIPYFLSFFSFTDLVIQLVGLFPYEEESAQHEHDRQTKDLRRVTTHLRLRIDYHPVFTP